MRVAASKQGRMGKRYLGLSPVARVTLKRLGGFLVP